MKSIIKKLVVASAISLLLTTSVFASIGLPPKDNGDNSSLEKPVDKKPDVSKCKFEEKFLICKDGDQVKNIPLDNEYTIVYDVKVNSKDDLLTLSSEEINQLINLQIYSSLDKKLIDYAPQGVIELVSGNKYHYKLTLPNGKDRVLVVENIAKEDEKPDLSVIATVYNKQLNKASKEIFYLVLITNAILLMIGEYIFRSFKY